MPDGLTHVNYQLRAFRPGPVIYVNMVPGGRISDYFGGNIIHPYSYHVIAMYIRTKFYFVSTITFEAIFSSNKASIHLLYAIQCVGEMIVGEMQRTPLEAF